MASVWRHPESKYYSACFTDLNGRRLKRSTKKTNKREAQKLADIYELGYRKQMTEAQIRSVVNDMFREVHDVEFQTRSTKEVFQEFLRSKKMEIGASSYERYEGIVSNFLKSLGEEKQKTPLAAITWRDIENYKTIRLERKLAPSTINVELKILKFVFSAALTTGEISEDPTEKVNRVHIGNKTVQERRPFTLPEVKMVYKAADEVWKGLIIFGLYTGQRLGDISKLTWGQIDLQTRKLDLKTIKAGRKIILPLHNSIYEYLSLIPPKSRKGPIFPKQYESVERTGRTNTVSKQFKKILSDVGLAEKRTKKAVGAGQKGPRKSSPLSFHSLRHTTTSILKQSGASQAVAMSIIGHDSEAVNDQYTHIDDQTVEKYISMLPDLS